MKRFDSRLVEGRSTGECLAGETESEDDASCSRMASAGASRPWELKLLPELEPLLGSDDGMTTFQSFVKSRFVLRISQMQLRR